MMTRPNANPTSALECCAHIASSNVASRQSSRRELDKNRDVRARSRSLRARARRVVIAREGRGAHASLDRAPSHTLPAIALETPRSAVGAVGETCRIFKNTDHVARVIGRRRARDAARVRATSQRDGATSITMSRVVVDADATLERWRTRVVDGCKRLRAWRDAASTRASETTTAPRRNDGGDASEGELERARRASSSDAWTPAMDALALELAVFEQRFLKDASSRETESLTVGDACALAYGIERVREAVNTKYDMNVATMAGDVERGWRERFLETTPSDVVEAAKEMRRLLTLVELSRYITVHGGVEVPAKIPTSKWFAKAKARREECPFCKKAFVAHYLAAHIATKHTGIKPVECHFKGCSECFVTTQDLDRHVALVHEHKHTCKLCGLPFSTKQSKEKHEALAHTQGKSVACPIVGCGKMFKHAESMRTHVMHFHGDGSEKRMYQCEHPDCDETFRTKRERSTHSRQVHAATVPKKRRKPSAQTRLKSPSKMSRWLLDEDDDE
jgi:hypothetical protein